MFLNCKKFLFCFFNLISIYRISACWGNEKKTNMVYVEIDLTDISDGNYEKLRKFLKNNNTNVNLLDTNNNSVDKKNVKEDDKYETERNIIDSLKIVFLKNSNDIKGFEDIYLKDINKCCNNLQDDLSIYFDGSKDIVLSKDPSELEKYYEKKKNKDIKNIWKIEVTPLLRTDFIRENTTITNLQDKSLNFNISDKNNDILYFIFKKSSNNDLTCDIKFDLEIFINNKSKK